ncbi:MAG TPA: biotin--[acetyl-CoA-carboxylase] ligase [Vicinamibacterales bacterium]|nr:biotin--[acetyl-CoA-carboxylase] ligase [Vicinamibacterales bacterium]
MSFHPQPLPAELEEAIAARRHRLGAIARQILYFETIGSTNDVAASLAAGGGHEGFVVVADAQTAGRGRRGRVWFSPPTAGLYVSVVLAPARARIAPDRATALLTLSAGVALAEAVEQSTGLLPAIKWPNDLLVGRRKLAGILAEGVASATSVGLQAVVLGYGINVMPAAFPPDLASIATSLETELGRGVDRAALCAESLAALAARYEDLIEGRYDAILDAWRGRSFGSRGATVEWETPAGVRTGTTEGIDDMGALLVRTPEALERIVAGEVRWGLHAASD